MLAGLLFAWAALPACAQTERILDFNAEIRIERDGSLMVTETIAVESAGVEIKRGIFRDFPTDYRDRAGHRYRVDFEIVGVTRNGQPEPYHTERIQDGVRVYIGASDVLIPHGRHVYALSYRTDRQLGHFEDFDELYWNVTGNDWAFPIDHASARIHLPGGAQVLQQAGYTGPEGAQGRDYSFVDQGTGTVWFETTRPLARGEGLTVAVAWPPGFVDRPTRGEQAAYFLADNAAALIGAAALAILLLYYLVVWWRVGRDPEGGPIVAQYQPPAGISPAAARYLARMGFDRKTFAAAILSMAVKGFLKIHEGPFKQFTLRKTGDRARLSRGERAIARALFGRTRDEVELGQSDRSTIRSALEKHRKSLRTEFEQAYFVTNRGAFLFGIGATALMVPVVAVSTPDMFTSGFLTLWLAGWSVGVYFLIRQATRSWQAVLAGGGGLATVGAVLISLFALPFVGAELFALAVLANVASLTVVLILAGVLLVNFVFYHLLKAPTRLGRKTLDLIEGFQTYLAVAERDRMEFHNPPDETPELFERYLPYAMALDVEHSWSRRFAHALARAADPEARADGYRPRWYSGSGWHGGDLTGFSRSLSAGLAGAVAAASASRSSGSSGGGFSGGGGGGGGGGGW